MAEYYDEMEVMEEPDGFFEPDLDDMIPRDFNEPAEPGPFESEEEILDPTTNENAAPNSSAQVAIVKTLAAPVNADCAHSIEDNASKAANTSTTMKSLPTTTNQNLYSLEAYTGAADYSSYRSTNSIEEDEILKAKKVSL